jgi:hypothetical protein
LICFWSVDRPPSDEKDRISKGLFAFSGCPKTAKLLPGSPRRRRGWQRIIISMRYKVGKKVSSLELQQQKATKGATPQNEEYDEDADSEVGGSIVRTAHQFRKFEIAQPSGIRLCTL